MGNYLVATVLVLGMWAGNGHFSDGTQVEQSDATAPVRTTASSAGEVNQHILVNDPGAGVRPLPQPKRDCEIRRAADVPLNVRKALFAYCLVLGRDATLEAVRDWPTRIASGEATYADLILALLGSDEFQKEYGTAALSDRAYISFMYRLFLLRDADLGGLESYARQLAAGTLSRQSLAYGIITSSEFQELHRAQIIGNNTTPPAGQTMADTSPQ